MRIEVLNKDTFDLTGTISLYESFQWEPTYNSGSGYFQIDCPLSVYDLVKNQCIIKNTLDDDHLGVVTNIEKKVENEGGESLVVKGKMLEDNLIGKRVAKGAYSYDTKPVLTIVNNLFQANMLSADLGARKVDMDFVIPAAGIDVGNISYASENQMLDDEIRGLIQTAQLGYKAYVLEGRLKFEVYQGVDRTKGSMNPVVFSRDRGNVTEIEYSKDFSNFANFFYILGEKDDLDVIAETTVELGENVSGINRIEKVIDLSTSVPWPKVSDANDALKIEKTKYLEMLASKGKAVAYDYHINEVMDATMYTLGNLKYREDYNIGDVITCTDATIGFEVDLRINSVNEVWDENGYKVKPTLGTEVPKLTQRIKNMMKGVM